LLLLVLLAGMALAHSCWQTVTCMVSSGCSVHMPHGLLRIRQQRRVLQIRTQRAVLVVLLLLLQLQPSA
jgi:hypothetical protein